MKTKIAFLLILISATCNLVSFAQTDEEETNDEKVTDIDGNIYSVVKIGNQYWLGENLKVSRFLNGDSIQKTSYKGLWSTQPCRQIFSTDSGVAKVYGNYYNWYAISDKRGICPKGWHVPTSAEFDILVAAVREGNAPIPNILATGEYIDMRAMSGEDDSAPFTANLYNWNNTIPFDVEGADKFKLKFSRGSSGFKAPPAGFFDKESGKFSGVRNFAWFWTSERDLADTYDLDAIARKLVGFNYDMEKEPKRKHMGYSCRCIKD